MNTPEIENTDFDLKKVELVQIRKVLNQVIHRNGFDRNSWFDVFNRVFMTAWACSTIAAILTIPMWLELVSRGHITSLVTATFIAFIIGSAIASTPPSPKCRSRLNSLLAAYKPMDSEAYNDFRQKCIGQAQVDTDLALEWLKVETDVLDRTRREYGLLTGPVDDFLKKDSLSTP